MFPALVRELAFIGNGSRRGQYGVRPYLRCAECNAVRFGVVIPSVTRLAGDGVEQPTQGTRVRHGDLTGPAVASGKRRQVEIVERRL